MYRFEYIPAEERKICFLCDNSTGDTGYCNLHGCRKHYRCLLCPVPLDCLSGNHGPHEQYTVHTSVKEEFSSRISKNSWLNYFGGALYFFTYVHYFSWLFIFPIISCFDHYISDSCPQVGLKCFLLLITCILVLKDNVYILFSY